MGIQAIDDLPDIPFVDGLTLEDVTEMLIGEFKTQYKNNTGTDITLEKSDPYRILMLAQSVVNYQMFCRIDQNMRNNFLKYAAGDYLDYLGVFKNRPRKMATKAMVKVEFSLAAIRDSAEVIPAGTLVTADQQVFFETDTVKEISPGELSVCIPCTCTVAGTQGNGYAVGEINTLATPTGFIASVSNVESSGGGEDIESDSDYKEGIYNAPDKYSVAGPDDAWVANIKDFDSNIEDVYPDTVEGSGIDTFTILMKDGRLPEDEEISRIKEYLMQPTIRPLGTKVEVQAPTTTEYAIDFTYYIGKSNKDRAVDICGAVESAVEEYRKWQESKIGRDINPDKLTAFLQAAGVKRAVITSPLFTAISENAIAQCRGDINVAYGGVEND